MKHRFGIVTFASLTACASGAGAPPRSSTTTPPPESVTLPRTVVTPDAVATIPELYERSRERFAASEFEESASGFDRVAALDPDGELAPVALFYSGWAHDNLAHNEAALARYEQVARRYPEHELVRQSLVRSVRLAAYLEQWQRAGDLSDRVLGAYRDPSPIELVVAHSGKALSLISRDDPDGAAYFVEKGRGAVERARLDTAGALPRDLAQLYFALGEVRRLRGERIRFDPVPADFGATLERRCQLLLDAQSAYSDAMRAYDSHWSAMAGYRVGELYSTLHRDLMSVPPPPAATTQARRALFEGAMRLRYSVLLQKGRAMMEHTVAMAERTGEKGAWVERARESLRTIGEALEHENEALARLPHSREELQKALDDLAGRKASQREQLGAPK